MKAGTKRVWIAENNESNEKYNFLFGVIPGMKLKLSEINGINAKKVSELEPRFIEALKKIDTKV